MDHDATPIDSPRTLGSRFAAERESQGLSRADVAHRLRMSVSQVEALESGDYSRLPTGTFLRGFVRNYARALGLEAESMVAALNSVGTHEVPPKLVVASQNIRFDPAGDRLSHPYVKAAGVAAAALVLGFAGVYWWLFIRPTPPAGVARKPPVEAPAKLAPAPATPANPVAATAPAAPPEAKEEPARADVAQPPLPPKAVPADPAPARMGVASVNSGGRAGGMMAALDTAPVIAAGGSVIRLRFKGNSWVEIKDFRGKILLSRVNSGGSEAEVIGKAPFSVVVGNAPEVQMYYNDRVFDLEPHTRVAVARFTVE